MKSAFVVLFTSLFISGYGTYIAPAWGQSGRETDRQILGYQRIGQFVELNTARDAVFLAAETSFRYYAKRDFVWINEHFADRVAESIFSTDPRETVRVLKGLRVQYVVVNREQMKRRGVNDYIPREGLFTVLSDRQYFTEIYDAFNDDTMQVYRINDTAI